ncbi:hypothetical protein ACH58_25935 [Achromobacter xylosoxidans]|nr:hypothetical protein ACH58_25935 [Achromobacter xylosoxidans]
MDPRRFSGSEIPDGAIRMHHHVLTTGHTMIARLDSLGGLIKRTARMPRIDLGSCLESVVTNS